MSQLDRVDTRILNILLEDGRRSLREVGRLAGVTAPTVQTRVRRMMDRGLIRRVAPILDASKFEGGVVAVLQLAINPSRVEKVAEKLARSREVKGVYLTTGEENLVVRVVLDSLEELQRFSEALERGFRVKQKSSQMVLRVFKDEQAVLVRPGLGVRLKCETCNGSITGRPHVLKVAGRERFFCCKLCLGKFREKYGSRLKHLSIPTETLETSS